MCTIYKSGTQAINFWLSLRRFWRPLQMRQRTMSNIIEVFSQKWGDSRPKLTMDQLPCHKCVIQGQVLFSVTSSATCEDDVVICSGFIYSLLVPVPHDHCLLTTCHCIFLTLYFHLTRIFRAASSRYYILNRLFIRDTFFQLSPSCASTLRTNGIEFSNSFDW